MKTAINIHRWSVYYSALSFVWNYSDAHTNTNTHLIYHALMYCTSMHVYVFMYRNVLYLYKTTHMLPYMVHSNGSMCTRIYLYIDMYMYMYHISAFTPYAGRVYAINHHLSLTIHWALCNMLTKVDNTIHFIFGLQIARIYFLIPLNLVYVYVCMHVVAVCEWWWYEYYSRL